MTENPLPADLAARLRRTPKPRQLKFGLFQGDGWVISSSEDIVRLLCDVYNNRHAIADALDASTRKDQT